MTARPPRGRAAAGTPQGKGAALRDPLPGYAPRGVLQGRRALLFGGLAAGGPGRSVAAALAKEGTAVAVADTTRLSGLPPGARPVPRQRLGDDPVLLAAGLVSALGAWSLPIHCDPSSEADGREAVAHTALEFGSLDLLVVHGSAATGPHSGRERAKRGPGAAPAPRSSLGRLGGALRAVREARPFLDDGAAVVLLGERGRAVGGTAGVAADLRSLAGVLGGRGVRLSCLLPRAADTDADIAAAVADLASDTGRTGEVVGVAQVPYPQ